MQFFRHRFDTIEDYLHHRAPYLMVENILQIDDDCVDTSRTVTSDDSFLAGHFPGAPVFPGAMMQEFVTQSAGILIAANFNPMESYDTSDPNHNEYALGVLIKVKSARYKGFARPGDELKAHVKLNGFEGTLFDFNGSINVGTREIMRIRFLLSNIQSKVLVSG